MVNSLCVSTVLVSKAISVPRPFSLNHSQQRALSHHLFTSRWQIGNYDNQYQLKCLCLEK